MMMMMMMMMNEISMKMHQCNKCGELELCYECESAIWWCPLCMWKEVINLSAEIAKLTMELVHYKHPDNFSWECGLCVRERAQEKADFTDEPTYLWEESDQWNFDVRENPERRCETIYPERIPNDT